MVSLHVKLGNPPIYVHSNMQISRVSSLLCREAAIGNKHKSIQQLLLIADGLLICLVITKAESTTCQCEYLLKADTQIKSLRSNICCWFDSLIKGDDKSVKHLTITVKESVCYPDRLAMVRPEGYPITDIKTASPT